MSMKPSPGRGGRPVRQVLLFALTLLIGAGGAAFAQGACMINADCDDDDPCTVDTCNAALCVNTASGDGERAAGKDGICHTADDNRGLYGSDGLCATGDDVTGDGRCDADDNCPDAYNPGQVDTDGNDTGDACDPALCRAQPLFVADESSLYSVSADGPPQSLATGFAGIRGLAVTDFALYMSEFGSGRVTSTDRAGGSRRTEMAGLLGPWGVAVAGSIFPTVYVTESTSGRLVAKGLSGTSVVATGLSSPTGLALRADLSYAYVTEYASGELTAVHLGTGAVVLVASGLGGPIAVALNRENTIAYVAEYDAGELSAVNLTTGGVTLLAPTSFPLGVAVDPGRPTIFYVVEDGNGVVTIDTSIGTRLGPGGPVSPTAIALGTRPPVVLEIPEAKLAAPGATVTIPVTLDDVTGYDVFSADFTVEFDPAVLTASAVSAGSLAAGCAVNSNLGTAGRAGISVFCTTALSGSGPLVQISFTVGGTRAQGTRLTIASAELNEGFPPVCGEAGTFHVPVDISGRFFYYRNDATASEPSTKSVNQASLSLFDFDAGTFVNLAPTCSNQYAFTPVIPIRSYRVTPGKVGDFNGIDPFDASLVARSAVGLVTLTSRQTVAGDVTGNGRLTSFDAAQIARYSVGQITRFPVAQAEGSDWAFMPVPAMEPNQVIHAPAFTSPGSIDYTPIVESAENQDFLGILFGDVSGNWQTPTCSPALPGPSSEASTPADAGAPAGRAPHAPAARLDLPTLTAAPGEVIRAPIVARGAAGAFSVYLDLRFDPAVLRLRDVEVGDSAAGFTVVSNAAEPGQARIALFGTAPLADNGAIAVALFEIVGAPGSSSTLSLAAHSVNEGAIDVVVKDGRVRVHPSR
jgi:hypothetical protein